HRHRGGSCVRSEDRYVLRLQRRARAGVARALLRRDPPVPRAERGGSQRMTRRVLGGIACALAAGLLRAGAATAQQAPVTATTAQTQWEIIEDPILRDMARLDRIAPFEDLAPLWDFVDPDLQRDVEAALRRLDLDADAAHQRLAVALIDLT